MVNSELDRLVPRAVALQNYGTSGSAFFQSLFDGHPHILTTPFDYTRKFYHFWGHGKALEDPDLVAEFVSGQPHWFDERLARSRRENRYLGLHQLGPNRDETLHIPRAKFIDSLLTAMTTLDGPRRKRFFIAIHIAYAAALGREITYPAVLLYFVHSMQPQIAGCLAADFPDTRFLHTVRHPVQSIGSLLKTLKRSKELDVHWTHNLTEATLARVMLDRMQDKGNYRCYGATPYPAAGPGRAKAVRLEDLHQRPEATLNSICQWIGIPWHPVLLTSTYDGKLWWNQPGKSRINGFGTVTIRQTHDDVISRSDRRRLALLMRDKHEVWRYELPASVDQPWRRAMLLPSLMLPLKMERHSLPTHYRSIRVWRGLMKWMPGLLRHPFQSRLNILETRRAVTRDVGKISTQMRESGKIKPGGVTVQMRLKNAGSCCLSARQNAEDLRRGTDVVELLIDERPRCWRTRLGDLYFRTLAAAGWCGLVLRDYLVIRSMLLRGWWEGRRKRPLEVPLLPIRDDASESEMSASADPVGRRAAGLVPKPHLLNNQLSRP